MSSFHAPPDGGPEPTATEPAGDAADLYGWDLLAAGGVDGRAAADDRPSASYHWQVRASCGHLQELPLRRWCGGLTPVDHALLDRCAPPVLDVGCGPGRLTAGLAARGVRCLGLDRSAAAVSLASGRGAAVLQRCLWRPLPEEGAWATVLLADGNIGIGGDVGRLLRRLGRVVSPAGRIIAEVGAPGSGSGPVRLRLEATPSASTPGGPSTTGGLEAPGGPGESPVACGPGVPGGSPVAGGSTGAAGRWFVWARLAADDAGRLAGQAGLRQVGAWSRGGRWFVELAR